MTRGIKWDCQDIHTFCNTADRPHFTSNRESCGKIHQFGKYSRQICHQWYQHSAQTAARLIRVWWLTPGKTCKTFIKRKRWCVEHLVLMTHVLQLWQLRRTFFVFFSEPDEIDINVTVCYGDKTRGERIHLQGFIRRHGRKQAWVAHWLTGILMARRSNPGTRAGIKTLEDKARL